MDFEEVVCYSQTLILVVLVVGYILNLRNKQIESEPKTEIRCPSCKFITTDQNLRYCGNCGNMLSHSEGLRLEK